ncbi:MAG: ACP S-malonyltransferase [Actinomycetota bacterium]
MTTALVFAGQGSQREGMALPWRAHPSFSRWEEASDLLGFDVARLGTSATAEELREPAACQVALFVHAVVLLEAWQAAGGAAPAVTAGHSLGEYDALVAAGALDFASALALVDVRARATERAAAAHPGGLLACLGYERETVEAACAETGAHVANDNAPGQVVCAGDRESLEALGGRLSSAGGRGKVVALEVGAAYHSPHMASAVEELGAALDATAFADTATPVVANVDAAPHTAGGDWPSLLRRQVVSPVRWRETVAALAAAGVGDVVELGAAPVVTGLVKRTDRSLGRHAITTPTELEEALA